ncbi:predicted protein [Coccidioides posadasii str. Silveira]|uniref:Predicted protein n=1 Tax=Coccidioides posadasii (strain RMSCC 757 / Silveira) TaxID=443226 RepID=E9D495_COCPS|nr:predicted protein [Coccidioides posadasii str. Silveira]
MDIGAANTKHPPSDQLPADSLNGPDPQIRPAVTPVRYRRKICQYSLLPLRSEKDPGECRKAPIQ